MRLNQGRRPVGKRKTEKEYELSLFYSLQGTSWSLPLYRPGGTANSGLPEDSLSTPSVGAAGFGPGFLHDLGLGGPDLLRTSYNVTSHT